MVTLHRVGMFDTNQLMYRCLYYCVCYYTRDSDSCSRLHHHWCRDLASSMPCLRATLAHRTGVTHGLHRKMFISIYARNGYEMHVILW